MNPSLRTLLLELRHWTVPGGAILASAALWAYLQPDSSLLRQVVGGYPLVVFAASLLLAWRLRRSRVAGALLAVLLVFLLPWVVDASARSGALRLLVAFGVPATWIVLALLDDRPIFSRRGVVALVVAGAGIAGTVAVSLRWRGAVEGVLLRRWELPVLPWTVDGVSVLPVLWCGVLAWVALRRREPVVRGLVWSLVAVEAGLVFGPSSPRGGLFLLAGGIILGVAVVEGSFALAYHDELTGLPGRRALTHALDDLGRTYTIAMVDVDHFKRFNDRHGHDVGDQVLRLVARRLGRVAGGGHAYRYGGEEFTLVFSGSERKEALPHLEDLRRSVEAARFVLRGPGRKRKGPQHRGRGDGAATRGSNGSLSVTVSIGVAAPRKGSREPRQVLARADKALYRAKKKGRNRVEG